MSATLETEFQHANWRLRRYRLANGLSIVCAPDNAAPIVSFQTWLGVGSSDEREGHTGMAHLFEHLMFNQTTNLAPGEFDRRIESMGGDSNAATWVDWTYYRTSVPSARLADAVAIEAERLENLVLEATPLETERDVVIHERLLRVEDDVDGFLDEELFRYAFPKGHPYQWPTIGWMEDIKSLSLEDVRAFYKQHYVASGTTIIATGDFEEDEILRLIESHYGHLPKRPVPAKPTLTTEALAPQEFTYRKSITTPRLLMAYPTPEQSHDDWLTLSLISALLASGPSSKLYRSLVVDPQLATSVDCSVFPFRGPGLFHISANLFGATDMDSVIETIRTTLRHLAEKPLSSREIERAKAGVEIDFWLELDTLDGRGEALGHYETTLGDFRSLFTQAERLRSISSEDIQRVSKRYLCMPPQVLVRGLPENQVS